MHLCLFIAEEHESCYCYTELKSSRVRVLVIALALVTSVTSNEVPDILAEACRGLPDINHCDYCLCLTFVLNVPLL